MASGDEAILNGEWLSGDTFPSNPTPLQKNGFRRTDLDEVFFRDDSRSKWLSRAIYTLHFGHFATNSGTYLHTYGNELTSATWGMEMPWDCTLVAVGFAVKTSSTASIRIRADGTNRATVSISSAQFYNEKDTDANWDEGEFLSADVASGALTDGYDLALYYRRRAA